MLSIYMFSPDAALPQVFDKMKNKKIIAELLARAKHHG